MALTPSVLAMVLPANISPLARLTFDDLFWDERCSGSLFCQNGPADSRSSSELAERMAEGLDRPPQLSVGSLVGIVLTVVAVLWAIRRLLPLMSVGKTGAYRLVGARPGSLALAVGVAEGMVEKVDRSTDRRRGAQDIAPANCGFCQGPSSLAADG